MGKYNGPTILPGDFPPGFGPNAPVEHWRVPLPGLTSPVFDPSIRPRENLSGISFPLDVCWLLDTHTGQDEEIYARTDMDMGPARLRRKYTKVPHVRDAKIFLTEPDSKVFHEWYENTIGCGQLRFIAQFHDIGFGVKWFEAEFVEPWNAEYVQLSERNEDGNSRRAWKISVKVRLYGEGLDANPILTPKLGVSFKLPLVAQSKAEVVKKLTVDFTLPLTSVYNSDTMSVNFSLPLESHVVGYEPWKAYFATYLVGESFVIWKNRFKVDFKLPLE